ncbi:hypothetical protein [Paraburkholderia sp. SIMBA_030]|uniref:hypothetical protein n=1 Tax=Paraburkholderia sp. SIMBA_030 TaxID=3085773 RepID=UPI00397B3809
MVVKARRKRSIVVCPRRVSGERDEPCLPETRPAPEFRSEGKAVDRRRDSNRVDDEATHQTADEQSDVPGIEPDEDIPDEETPAEPSPGDVPPNEEAPQGDALK